MLDSQDSIRTRFWARGYFCTTSGNVTNETILNYIATHTNDEPTGISR